MNIARDVMQKSILKLTEVKIDFEVSVVRFYLPIFTWLKFLEAKLPSENIPMDHIIEGVVKYVQKEMMLREMKSSSDLRHADSLDMAFVINEDLAVVRMIYQDRQRLSAFYTVERKKDKVILEEFNFYPKWDIPKETADPGYYIVKVILNKNKSCKIFFREFYRFTDGPVEMIQPGIFLSLCKIKPGPNGRIVSINNRIKTIQEGKYWLLGTTGKHIRVI